MGCMDLPKYFKFSYLLLHLNGGYNHCGVVWFRSCLFHKSCLNWEEAWVCLFARSNFHGVLQDKSCLLQDYARLNSTL